MNNPIQPVHNATKPDTNDKQREIKSDDRDKQRGFGVVELLFAAATLGATVVAAMGPPTPKIPKSAGD